MSIRKYFYHPREKKEEKSKKGKVVLTIPKAL